jgi:SanA protein
MLRSTFKMLFRLLLILAILVPMIVLLPRLVIFLYAQRYTYTSEKVPPRSVAVVFGAGLWRDGSPTPVLRDREETAANLYFQGKVTKLLMSGGRASIYYDEPGAMRAFALSLGVPEQAVLLDYAGDRSYDTCYRAKHIFALDSVVLVTQRFHLPRTLFLCNQLGLPAVGVEADRRIYRRSSTTFWNLRELPATLTAIWDVYVARPIPNLSTTDLHIPGDAQ